ncbi:PilZ domain-containing protein [Salidesulfovibrio onnuriiensis]|uniref:PilZ domain-containing protein n=1 Tax=Salidesulfovibrio onnuriiensis TaxID=2583823 RepID=UPI001650A346|nr:PilZ domain-containing protein [Salidesulfovibrio onnuriiensis]
MVENRKHERIELFKPLICHFNMANGNTTFCSLKNISLSGALVECRPNWAMDELEPGIAVQLVECTPRENALFNAVTGMLVWSYKNYYGIEFDDQLSMSTEKLTQWLTQNGFIS